MEDLAGLEGHKHTIPDLVQLLASALHAHALPVLWKYMRFSLCYADPAGGGAGEAKKGNCLGSGCVPGTHTARTFFVVFTSLVMLPPQILIEVSIHSASTLAVV